MPGSVLGGRVVLHEIKGLFSRRTEELSVVINFLNSF